MSRTVIYCPVCGSKSQEIQQYTCRSSVRCCQDKTCGHLFDSQYTDGQGMHNSETDQHKDYSVYESRNRRLIGYLCRRHFLKDGMRVLDVGAGTGHIDKAILSVLDVELSVVESCPEYQERLRSIGCESYGDIGDLPGDVLFDACLMIEVIEHLADPVAFMSAVGHRLRPGAGLFLTTPAGVMKGFDGDLETFSISYVRIGLPIFLEKHSSSRLKNLILR